MTAAHAAAAAVATTTAAPDTVVSCSAVTSTVQPLWLGLGLGMALPMGLMAIASMQAARPLSAALRAFLSSPLWPDQVSIVTLVLASLSVLVQGIARMVLVQQQQQQHLVTNTATQSRSSGSSMNSNNKFFFLGGSDQRFPTQEQVYAPLLEELSRFQISRRNRRTGQVSNMIMITSNHLPMLFDKLYPHVRDQLLQQMQTLHDMPDSAVQQCRDLMDYTVPGGKLNRGTTVVAVYQALLVLQQKQQEQQQNPNQAAATAATVVTEEETDVYWVGSRAQLVRAIVCGWAIEFLQAFFLVADDIMDDSVTRRGQPCWYRQAHVKLTAINDSFLLESFVFGLLRTYVSSATGVSNEPQPPCWLYHDLVQLMLDVIHKTELGQLLDLATAAAANPDADAATTATGASSCVLDRFTLEQYRRIVRYKTAYYSFYLPVAMGLRLADVRDPDAYAIAQRICCTIGEYFQVQDDYLDCFGDPAVIGKIGTDIQDNKCSWCVVTALRQCTAEQRQILVEYYGRGISKEENDESVEKVKALYRELNLPAQFQQYEEESYRRIQAELAQLADTTDTTSTSSTSSFSVSTVPRAVFDGLFNKIYKRKL